MTDYIAPRGTKTGPAQRNALLAIRGVQVQGNVRSVQLSRAAPPPSSTTELFTRNLGETTDVVSKEMYTFKDRSGRDLTLRQNGAGDPRVCPA